MPLAPMAVGVRWAGLAISLVVAAMQRSASIPVAAWGLALGGFAAWRSLQSRRPQDRRRKAAAERPMASVLEVALAAGAMAATGAWGSPLVFALLGSVAAVGMGFFDEPEECQGQALLPMSQLSEANDLLVSLHRVARSLPASLDLNHVLASTLWGLRHLIECDVVTILLRDDATGGWTLAASEGAAPSARMADGQLPGPLRAATASSVASLVVSLAPGESIGPQMLARSGLYAPLRARGALIGLVAVEHHEPGFYDRRDLRLLDGLIEPAGLAIDNARWFARLRTMGADEERTRIARDMHDSVGQSLAYIAFKLDRLRTIADGHPLSQELDTLRSEVRGVLREVRDTLCDLRTDVTDQSDLAETLQAFLERVRERADFEVSFLHESSGRLPVVQERELWRIAHEAIVNVERHAGARHLRVRWECDGRRGRITVADDGRGFAVTESAGRSDAYGIRGMRERADAIGARLEIESEPYVGTIVDCRLSATATGGDPADDEMAAA